jgi:hypothetical protein
VKSNLGTKGAYNKMIQLIKDNHFISLSEADSMIQWDETKRIKL